jgi:hypothetical protein
VGTLSIVRDAQDASSAENKAAASSCETFFITHRKPVMPLFKSKRHLDPAFLPYIL